MSKETSLNETAPRLGKGMDWRTLVAWVGDLPPMPQVASHAIQLLEKPEVAADELTTLIARDAALATRILKIANSAMFCRQREVVTLHQAIMVIGLKALKGIIAAATLADDRRDLSPLKLLIWEHAICTALCTTQLAKKLRKKFVDEVFLLGLLHNLGQVILLSNDDTAALYNRVMDEIDDLPVTYVVAEEEILGFSHPLIGALVAKKWNFSADTCQTILHYRDPIDTKPELEQDQKTALVQLADLLVHELGIGSPANYPRGREEIERLALLVGFDPKTAPTQIDTVLRETAQQFENEKALFG
jgi:HD-like signal output (HDOD) protein